MRMTPDATSTAELGEGEGAMTGTALGGIRETVLNFSRGGMLSVDRRGREIETCFEGSGMEWILCRLEGYGLGTNQGIFIFILYWSPRVSLTLNCPASLMSLQACLKAFEGS